MDHFLNEMRIRFPRLNEVVFTESEKDEYRVEGTPAGKVETLYFYERPDFENALIALAYKLEPREIPKSTGAMFISGLLDHQTMEKIAMVIISRGGYSGITADALKKLYLTSDNIKGCALEAIRDITEERWCELSKTIRTTHELAHFVQRKLYPENKDAIKDEIKADMTGIIKAFGCFDSLLVRVFLGIEGTEYRPGGRLENYVNEDEAIEMVCGEANAYIDTIEQRLSGITTKDAFEILEMIEKSEKTEI